MICIYTIIKRQSDMWRFPRRFNTIIQNWTFFFNMVCLKHSSYLTDQLFLYSDKHDLT